MIPRLITTCPKQKRGNYSNKTHILLFVGDVIKEIVHLCVSLVCAAVLNRAHSYWFLMRGHEVIVLGLHQTSLWAVDGPPSSSPSWHQLSPESRVIIQASEHRIASQVMGWVAAERQVLIGPSIFSPVALGGAMKGTSPEDARTMLLLRDEPFIPALQSSLRRFKEPIFTFPKHSPRASIMVIYAWKNQCSQPFIIFEACQRRFSPLQSRRVKIKILHRKMSADVICCLSFLSRFPQACSPWIRRNKS